MISSVWIDSAAYTHAYVLHSLGYFGICLRKCVLFRREWEKISQRRKVKSEEWEKNQCAAKQNLFRLFTKCTNKSLWISSLIPSMAREIKERNIYTVWLFSLLKRNRPKKETDKLDSFRLDCCLYFRWTFSMNFFFDHFFSKAIESLWDERQLVVF